MNPAPLLPVFQARRNPRYTRSRWDGGTWTGIEPLKVPADTATKWGGVFQNVGFRRLVDSSLESGKQRWTLPKRAGRVTQGAATPRWIRLARKGRGFAPRFLQTPPRDDALALR